MVDEMMDKKNNIMVKDMPISQKLKYLLIYYGGINTLEELLMTDYRNIKNIKAINEYDLRILKRYVHGLGFELLNEKLSEKERRKQLKRDGKLLLEDLGIAKKIYLYFYGNGIYTLDELIDIMTAKKYPNEIKWVSEFELHKFSEELGNLGIIFNLGEEDLNMVVKNSGQAKKKNKLKGK